MIEFNLAQEALEQISAPDKASERIAHRRLWETVHLPVGFTGDITDGAGRHYHFLHGKRVGKKEYEAHIAGGGKGSRAVHHTPFESDEEAEKHVNNLPAGPYGHHQYYVNGAGSTKEMYERTHHHLQTPHGRAQALARAEKAKNAPPTYTPHNPHADYSDTPSTKIGWKERHEQKRREHALEKGPATDLQVEMLNKLTKQLGMKPGGPGVTRLLKREKVRNLSELTFEQAYELFKELTSYVDKS